MLIEVRAVVPTHNVNHPFIVSSTIWCLFSSTSFKKMASSGCPFSKCIYGAGDMESLVGMWVFFAQILGYVNPCSLQFSSYCNCHLL